MYAKCGALEEAQELFCMHKSRDVFVWTTLIAGCAEKGQGHDALNFLGQMQHEGLSPDAVTFACVLKACGRIGAIDKGEEIHDQVSKEGLLDKHVVLGTALVDMYAKCGALAKARRVLEELIVRNVISWTALIAGYAEHGEYEQALECFGHMQGEGLSPNVVTFICILKSCGGLKSINKGAEVHEEISKKGLLKNNLSLGTSLVDMYAKCGALMKARQVLEELPQRDVVSWNAIIAGYIEQGENEKALGCLEGMNQEGLSPDAVTFTCFLKACSSLGAIDKGEQIHNEIAKKGFLRSNGVLGTALVEMYAKSGALAKARQLLEDLPVLGIVAWNAMLAGHAQRGEDEQLLNIFEDISRKGLPLDEVTFIYALKACANIGSLDKGETIHEEIAKQEHLVKVVSVGTALVDMYAKCGALQKARKVLEELPIRNVISWSALISGYVEHGKAEQALNCFEEMQQEGLSADAVTFICILKACTSMRAADWIERIHDEISKQGLLGNSIALGNALLDVYAKCGTLSKALHVLKALPVRDVTSWNAIIMGYAQQGKCAEALESFKEMQNEGICPNGVTFLSTLKACGKIGAADKGEEIHEEIAKLGVLGKVTMLGAALVDMYAKCGALPKAQQVLQELPNRNVGAWNALIAGYVQDGKDEQAWSCFQNMQREGLCGDALTFSSILKACATMGALEKGVEIHDEIAKEGLLSCDIVLGTALVDMYAKCGSLTRARQVLLELPLQTVSAWNALITGYVLKCEGAQALASVEQMQHKGLSPDAATFTCILSACSRLGLIEDAQMYFINLSAKYGLKPELEHFTCIIDLFGRAGHLYKAVEMLEDMPACNINSAVWCALLGACGKWGDANVGRWAFDRAGRVNKTEAGFYIMMANIYAAVGMHKDAEDIKAIRISLGA